MMEDYYSTLGCRPDCTSKEIKDAYQRLCIQFHPDKNHEEDSTTKFVSINQAYKVLIDSDLKQEYDAKWQQRTLAQQWPIQEEVNFDEFEHCEDEESNYENVGYPCRCGGDFVLGTTDVTFKVDFVQCLNCSLCIKVKYNKHELEEVYKLFPT